MKHWNGKMKFYIGSDNLIVLTGLYDLIDANYINDATIKAEIFAHSAPETQIGGDITLSYIAGSDGNYRGQLANDVALVIDTLYILVVTVTIDNNQLVIKVHSDSAYVNEG